MSAAQEWQDAETAIIDDRAYYLTKTDGDKWGDPDLYACRGAIVKRRLHSDQPHHRPLQIALINKVNS